MAVRSRNEFFPLQCNSQICSLAAGKLFKPFVFSAFVAPLRLNLRCYFGCGPCRAAPLRLRKNFPA
jgi:hypothetical protein